MPNKRAGGSGFVRQDDIPKLEMFPDLKHLAGFDPSSLTASDVLKVFTLALAQTVGADPLIRLRAEAVMNEQFARGHRAGMEAGRREGYNAGYPEGLEDGRREALDELAARQAESASRKAAARARRAG